MSTSSSATAALSTTPPDLNPPFQKDESIDIFGPHAWSPTLPATYHDLTHKTHRVQDSIPDFLSYDLNLSRLDKVHYWLGVAGWKGDARALHRQRLYNRTIVPTEQMDLHLLWFEDNIFIKPLPDYLLNYDFWDKNLCGNSKDGNSKEDEERHKSALGLLLSYSWLICHPSDFHIANGELHLLPNTPALTYHTWTKFMESVTAHITSNPDLVHRRYQYGELRLKRLNLIYRLAPCLKLKHCVRGYHVLHHSYSSFFKRHFSWITITLFAYFALVLTAMQVGLGTNGLKDNETFNSVSEWVAVVCMATPLGIVALAVVLFVFHFLNNAIATLINLIRKSKQKRKAETTRRSGGA